MASGMSLRRARWIAVLALPAALAACGPKASSDENLDSLDAELTDAKAGQAPAKDPALMSALQSQIMVDPTLAQQSNGDAIRPPGQPYASPLAPESIAAANADGAPVAPAGPLMRAPAPADDGQCPKCAAARESVTLGALAARQSDTRTSGCVAQMRYSAGWANRLPRDLPLYPDARVAEAAGSDNGNCAMRAVSFSSGATAQTILDWYFTRATSTGYQAEQEADGDLRVLGGTRTADGGAFVVYVSPRDGGGVDVDMIANNGG